jgi:hypothetical protein
MAGVPYVLEFDGPIPAYSYFGSRGEGAKARTKARAKGYKVKLYALPGAVEAMDAKARLVERDGDNDNNQFLAKLRDKFRRKARTV